MPTSSVARLFAIALVSWSMLVVAACGDDDGGSTPDAGGSPEAGTAGRGGRGSDDAGGVSGSHADAGGTAGSRGGGSGGSGGRGGSGGSGGSGDDEMDAGDFDSGTDDDDDDPDLSAASQEIAALRAAANGTGLALPVHDVYVTYQKPEVGNEPAGFFVQAQASGPAIFVAIDPATLTPALDVGDLIDFTVTGLTTTGTLKQVTSLVGLVRSSTGHSIEPLISELSAATDLVSALDDYESRVIRVAGDLGAFLGAGTGFVAAPIATAGLTHADLRLRVPEQVRAAYDLVSGCTVSVDHGVMWRLNSVAQPSVYSDDALDVTCPAPTVISAAAMDATHVRVIFDRKIDAATATSGRFTFDNGATASAVSVDGAIATVTTSTLATSTYTVTVSSQVTDLLGAGVATPSSAMFEYELMAVVALNELGPNISSVRDLIELRVLSTGSVNGITVVQRGSLVETLVTLPDIVVTMNDLIVVHLNPSGATGAAPGSETTAKNQYANASFSANYDGAWDFHGGTTGLSYSNRILEVLAPGAVQQDVVPVVVSTSAMPPAAFPGLLQELQANAQWLPADCSGQLCTYVTTPTAVAISVDYLGVGTTATGNTISRKVGGFGSIKTDWNAAAAHSWGMANP